jgi:hypothetical protein
LNHLFYDDNIFEEHIYQSNEEYIVQIIQLIDHNTISETYLDSIASVDLLIIVFRRILMSYEPVVPYSQYDHMVSPIANYNRLIPTINQHRNDLFDVIMSFLAKIVLNPSLLLEAKRLAISIGIYLLQPESSNLTQSSSQKASTEDVATRQEVMVQLIDRYCKVLNSQATLNLANPQPNNARNSLNSSDVPQPPAQPQQPPSIQDRSVKVVFANPEVSKLTQDEVKEFFTQCGTVVNVSISFFFTLFSLT